MIVNRIVYCATSAALINRYQADADKDSKYWGHDDVTPVRKEIKNHYIKEQQHLCCYCGIPDPSNHGSDWDVEHVVPQQSRPDFMFTQENLAVACKECNSFKSAKETLVDPSASSYPSASDAFLIVHPHFDDWTDHILRDHLTYASFTDKGKWTIKECRLNRLNERIVGLRYPISDTRYEDTVRNLLAGGLTLQEALDDMEHSAATDAKRESDTSHES